MLIVELLKSFFLGVVEGITEWLPISSTGHLILVDEFIKLNVTTEFMDMYRYVIQLGAILAVLVLFFHKLNPFSPRKSSHQKRQTWTLWGLVVLACIPSAVIGLPLNDWMDEHLMNPWVVAAALIVYGVGFLMIEDRRRTPAIRRTSDLTWQIALCIGLFQALSIIPGTSRSGATILGAIILGCARPVAAEFSFFLAIPTMVGVSVLKLGKFFAEKIAAGEALFTGPEAAILAVGFIVSFVVSLLCIRFLMDFVKKQDFKPFGWYRIVLGILVLLFFGIRALVA
ncbi:MAG: undecaprenyl-diphosphate phosphatase [Flintibacter sp.]|uniref:undecaprenyl-diphosphate phosphatase n=1 Tax=Flintibacter sp. TaxID=1918624 RepID=UPI0026739901|nr:undecaprenyl-diphosphate phosphatase [Flintibacter sp.]MCI6149486.1 undecaprenyl-diphosphate phosphatase [Flintibacter sp.]MDD7116922.1 undecaprenyl-diphosphate phosphatase [Flintibacter sp.]MDY5039126.1 undecaprenyl-diphosphate phosphatase [Lawsonibacter sp.]